MNKSRFKEIVSLFQDHPTPGRKLFVCHGTKEGLLTLLPNNLVHIMDLINIIPPTGKTTEQGIRRHMKQAISKTLEDLISNLNSQQILVVLNSYLMARYKVPLAPFYEIYFSDRTMVIFHVEKHKFQKELPGFTTYTSNACLKYLVNTLPQEHKDNIIEEEV